MATLYKCGELGHLSLIRLTCGRDTGAPVHPPNAVDVLTRKAPVAAGAESTPQLDGMGGIGPTRDLAGDELLAAQRAFVVEQDAAGGEHAKALAVIHGDIVTKGLGHTVRRARMERLFPRRADKALGGEVVELVHRHIADQAEDIGHLGQVEIVQDDPIRDTERPRDDGHRERRSFRRRRNGRDLRRCSAAQTTWW